MFIPNTTALLYSRTDIQDLYGGYSYAPARLVDCAVTEMNLAVKKTSVRADSSASRGRAEEELGHARLLFSRTTVIAEGDVVVLGSAVLEVVGVFPRIDVLGALDHFQVDFRKGTLPS